MGPVATAYFYNKIIEYAQKKYGLVEDHEYPPMIIYNLPLFDMTEEGIKDENIEIARQQLQEAALSLESAGADFLVIPCNTVHYFLSEIREAVSIPVVDIREETARKIAERKCASVGICATKSSLRWDIFSETFSSYGIYSYFLDKKEEEVVSLIISRIMQNLHDNKDKELLKKIAFSFRKKGINGMLLGCTELPLALEEKEINGFPLFNSSSILAEVAVDWALGRLTAKKNKKYNYARS